MSLLTKEHGLPLSVENYESLRPILSPEEVKPFEENLAHHRCFHVETWDVFNETENLFYHKDTVQSFPKVYLLTDGKCSSTCWLFVREMLQMPNVIQIGEKTCAQSLYSQARWVTLPSGLSKLYFPMQQRVTPLDHINQPFVPSYTYSDNWTDEGKVRKWVIKIINMIFS